MAKKEELQREEAEWKQHMCTAAAWCAAHNIPLHVGPGFAVTLDRIADVLEGAIAAAGPDNVPEGVALYMICLRETATFIRLHGTVGDLAAIVREQAQTAQKREQANAPAAPAKKHAARRAGTTASK